MLLNNFKFSIIAKCTHLNGLYESMFFTKSENDIAVQTKQKRIQIRTQTAKNIFLHYYRINIWPGLSCCAGVRLTFDWIGARRHCVETSVSTAVRNVLSCPIAWANLNNFIHFSPKNHYFAVNECVAGLLMSTRDVNPMRSVARIILKRMLSVAFIAAAFFRMIMRYILYVSSL